jgi:type IV pilus biogenesis protein CpaD/CtpE
MTREKGVDGVVASIKEALESWAQEVGLKKVELRNHDAKVTLTIGNPDDSLTETQKSAIRDFFVRLAESITGLVLIAKHLANAGKEMCCLFEFRATPS